MQQNYLESVEKQFGYYKMLGEKALSQLSEKELSWKYNNESNSIAVIVNHLNGNMLSRWTDFLKSDGEKEWRERDAEFNETIKSKENLFLKWNAGWSCLFEALNAVNKDNFETKIYIRNQGHTVTEAINRQLSHYAYHIGQIVFIARMIKGAEWQSLSIPKGNSKIYNSEKFAKPKRKEHFTEELISKTHK